MASTSNTRGRRPCVACSFTLRKCSKYCREAEIFKDLSTVQEYETIFKTFGVENAAKFLSNRSEKQYHQTLLSLFNEVKERIYDPVGGCTTRIMAIEKKMEQMQ